jgi:hydroxymethylbilane synthase
MRVGTRGSALALVQARWVVARLEGEAEIVEIKTAGDRGESVSDKSRWVSALEAALLSGAIDVAVHSAKDVPGEIAAGTSLAAFPVREDPRDALIGFGSLADLPVGGRVGTSSLRRAAQLLALRGDLEVVEVRGNIDTRLRKLGEDNVDALVLAAAGLIRLGLESRIGCYLDELVPAAGQGALALQVRVGEARLVDGVGDQAAGAELEAERSFTGALGASCATAVGASAVDSGGFEVQLTGWVGLPDGSEWIEDVIVGPSGAVGVALAERMSLVGARELLARAEALQ